MRWLVLAVCLVSPSIHAEEKTSAAPVPAAQDDAAVARVTKEESATIQKYIKALASEDFEVREQASKALSAMGTETLDLLKAAVEPAQDPEVRARLIQLVKEMESKVRKATWLDGAKKLASGLQIKVLVEGKGAHPNAADQVKVHYSGYLLDGTEFDSSRKSGEPVTFPLNNVIQGWTEGLQLMREGEKARLIIPPNLGYGERGAPPTIPANTTLVFDVELLEVVKKEK